MYVGSIQYPGRGEQKKRSRSPAAAAAPPRDSRSTFDTELPELEATQRTRTRPNGVSDGLF
jgi:hypothetical protein